jgi:hypothetical protein
MEGLERWLKLDRRKFEGRKKRTAINTEPAEGTTTGPGKRRSRGGRRKKRRRRDRGRGDERELVNMCGPGAPLFAIRGAALYLDQSSGGYPCSVPKSAAFRHLLSHPIPMKKKDLTLKLVLTVPCPTCGVAPGQRCVLYLGAQRTGPHVNRKLFAAGGAIEVKQKSSS